VSSAAWPAMAKSGQNEPRKVAQIEVLAADPTPTGRRTKLGNIREIRAELARVYRKAKSAEIDTTTATRLTYILTQLANLTMDSDIEERLTQLENGQ
jgi:hypothetical protein